jgi:hypothetical protein
MRTEEEIIKRWKDIVEFTSKFVPPLPEEDKIPMALALEECEQKYVELDENKFIVNSYFLKYLIPQIRRSENKLDIGEDEIVDGRQCMIINNGELFTYKGMIAIPYECQRPSAHWEDVFYINDKGTWEQFFNR